MVPARKGASDYMARIKADRNETSHTVSSVRRDRINYQRRPIKETHARIADKSSKKYVVALVLHLRATLVIRFQHVRRVSGALLGISFIESRPTLPFISTGHPINNASFSKS